MDELIEELRQHEAVARIDETASNYKVYVRDYGNATVLGKLKAHKLGNATIEGNLLMFNVRKPRQPKQ